MYILYLTGRELEYARNDALLRAFQRLGQVDIVTATVSENILKRSLLLLPKTLFKLLNNTYDFIFVGFYGHFLMLPIGLLSKQIILFDAFVSTYDTMCFDRKKFSPNSLLGKFSYWLDDTSCRLADHILLDTVDHAQYFVDTFGIIPSKITSIPVGCNEDLFHPESIVQKNKNQTDVLYYCTYLPLHGVDILLKAIYLLQSEPLQFKLVGQGATYVHNRQLAEALNLKNVSFVPIMPIEALPAEINQADICLGGHFGVSDKAQRVVPGKVYQMLAMAKPIIATSTVANTKLLTHLKTAYLCPPENPNALAKAILELHKNEDLRQKLATAGRKLYEQSCSEAIIQQQLEIVIAQLLSNANPSLKPD